MIEQLLVMQLTILKEGKPKRTELFKLVNPYSGSSKFSELEDWLMGICINYAMAQLGGDKREHEKVLSEMDYLSNSVLKWYLHYVLHVNRMQEYWMLQDVVLGLYN